MMNLHRFLREDRGSVAILFSLSLLIVMAAVGLSIDGARAYNVATRVSAALDAAALAAAKMLDDDAVTDEEIRERAQRFFAAQLETIPITATTMTGFTATIDRQQSEIVVTADVRMGTSFAQILQIDAIEFRPSARVNYAMKRIELALVLDMTGSMCNPCSKIGALKVAAKDIVDALISPHTPHDFVRIALVPYSAAVNAGPYASAVSSPPSPDQCVVERTSSAAFTNAAPTGIDRLGTATSSTNPQYACPSAPIHPLTADRDTLRAAIDGLSTGSHTAGHIGLAWGWYLLSRSWASYFPRRSQPRAPANNVVKAVLLMTDGMFNTSYVPGPGLNSTDPATPQSSAHQALQLCDNMKADGITIYTVAFDAPTTAANLLRDCATSSAHAFVASSAYELRQAFVAIADQLATLRLIR